MPQMFPMLWTSLFLSTALMLMIMMIMMSFLKTPSKYSSPKFYSTSNQNWKW